MNKLKKQDLLDVKSRLESIDQDKRIYEITGLNGQLSGSIKKLVQKINEAVDKLNSSTGQDGKERDQWQG